MARKEFSYAEVRTDAQRRVAAEHIDHHREIWGAYGSDLSTYNLTFFGVLNGTPLEDLISTKEQPLVVDLMAPSGTLAELFRILPQQKKRGICVSLVDQRISFERERDEVLGIKQLKGDLTERKTWEILEGEMKGQKADLIIERGLGGVDYLPNHGRFYGPALQRVWKMTSKNYGTILLDSPSDLVLGRVGYSKKGWVDLLEKQGIEAKSENDRSTIRIVKKPNSPEKLPFIEPSFKEKETIFGKLLKR